MSNLLMELRGIVSARDSRRFWCLGAHLLKSGFRKPLRKDVGGNLVKLDVLAFIEEAKKPEGVSVEQYIIDNDIQMDVVGLLIDPSYFRLYAHYLKSVEFVSDSITKAYGDQSTLRNKVLVSKYDNTDVTKLSEETYFHIENVTESFVDINTHLERRHKLAMPITRVPHPSEPTLDIIHVGNFRTCIARRKITTNPPHTNGV